jgi:hypothetical protein
MYPYFNCFGSFYSFTPQQIKPDEEFKIERNSHLLNLSLENNKIIVKKSGIFVINLLLKLNKKSGQIAIFKNNQIITDTISSGNNIILLHSILQINSNDELTIKNISKNQIETSE